MIRRDLTLTELRLKSIRRGITILDVVVVVAIIGAVVERGGKPIDLLRGKPNVTPDNPNADYPGQVGWSASNTFPWAMNNFRVGINQSNSTGIYSLHSGGANVALADGSVRFLSESTDFNELVRLFSRSGGPDE